MLEFLVRYINNIKPMPDEVINDILAAMEISTYPKNHLFLKEGQICDYIYVVIKGILRLYYIKDGEEICSRLSKEEEMCISVESFYSRKKGYEFIETIEESVVAKIHFDKLMALYQKHMEFNFVGREITQTYFLKSEKRLYFLRKQKAEERYQYFLENYPDLILRVPLTYIASYLGLSLETLSRVRKKISLK